MSDTPTVLVVDDDFLSASVVGERVELETDDIAQGSGGGSTVNISLAVKEAGMDLGGHRVVVVDSAGRCYHGNNLNESHKGAVLGITLGAAPRGTEVSVLKFGKISMAGWSFTPGLPVYLVEDGLLSQTPPSTGFILEIGVVSEPDTIEVRIQKPILTEGA